MSTSYYFAHEKEREQTELINDRIRSLLKNLESDLMSIGVEVRDDTLRNIYNYLEQEYEPIHIGKRSIGWKPLLQACEHFKSIMEMKAWYVSSSVGYFIENEYGEELTWKELEDELINWEGKRNYLREDIPLRHISYFTCEDGREWT